MKGEIVEDGETPEIQQPRIGRRRLVVGVAAVGSAAALGGFVLKTVLEPRTQEGRQYKVVFLFTRLTEPVVQSQIATTKAGLADLGYIEGRNVSYDARDAAGEPGRFPDLAAEVVELAPDVIVCQSAQAAMALKSATKTIPIVFVGLSVDPVEAGLLASRGRPAENLTGFSAAPIEIWSKRLQLLKEAAPSISRLAVLRAQTEPSLFLAEMERVAPSLGMQIVPIDLRSPADLEPGLAAAVSGRANALAHTQPANQLVGSSTGVPRIAQFALQMKWPSIVNPAHGGLMTYDAVLVEPWRRAATTIDKIFKGANPGDLPIEGPAGSVFRLNLCTAGKLGLTISPSLVAQATEVTTCVA